MLGEVRLGGTRFCLGTRWCTMWEMLTFCNKTFVLFCGTNEEELWVFFLVQRAVISIEEQLSRASWHGPVTSCSMMSKGCSFEKWKCHFGGLNVAHL